MSRCRFRPFPCACLSLNEACSEYCVPRAGLHGCQVNGFCRRSGQQRRVKLGIWAYGTRALLGELQAHRTVYVTPFSRVLQPWESC